MISLKAFHKFFIVICLAFCAFTAFWASGHNQQGVRSPWLLSAAIVGIAVLAPYLAWRLRKT